MGIKNTDNQFLLDFAISKKWRLVRHGCMIIILGVALINTISPEPLRQLNIPNIDKLVRYINYEFYLIYLLALICIYSNLLFLIPTFLYKKKYGLYLIGCIFLATFYFILQVIYENYFLKEMSKYITVTEFSIGGYISASLIPFIFLMGSAGYEIFKKWLKDNALLAEMKQAKTEQELANLKNQINPHFLFNTLNNLNTLISVDAAKASAVVLGLSDVLRYQLYEANEEKVLLKKDIEILQQYLELEKIRRDNFQFSITTDGDVFSVLIPPFIFINFVENAIKHSVDNTGFSFISVHFSLIDNVLVFTSKNSKPSIIKAKINGGLGLQNIKRRLELMYEEKFSLVIKDDKREFLITLQLPL